MTSKASPSRLVGALLAAALLPLLVAGCGGTDAALQSANAKTLRHMVLVFAGAPAHTKVITGDMVLCLTGHGRATITAVTPVHASGSLKVVRFGLLRYQPGSTSGVPLLGDDRSSWRTLGHVKRSTTAACDDVVGDQFVVQLSRPTARQGVLEDLRIDYVINGTEKTLIYPITLSLCAQAHEGTAGCRDAGQLAAAEGV